MLEKIVITVDGVDTQVFPISAPGPVVAPTDVEIDIVLSDGTTKKFVPAPLA